MVGVLRPGPSVSAVKAAVGHVRQDFAPSIGRSEGQISSRLILPAHLKGMVVRGSEIGSRAVSTAEAAPADERSGEIWRGNSGVKARIKLILCVRILRSEEHTSELQSR